MQRSISGTAWDVVAGFEAGVCVCDHGRRSDSGAVGGCVVAAVGVGFACWPVQLVSRATPSGRWWSATDGRHVGSESWLERDLMLLDFDPTVIAMTSRFGLVGGVRGPVGR